MSVAISNKLRCLLVPSTNVVVFTGAGVSAESGVPTFRGKDGLWNEFNVQELATPQAFAANPVRVWEWYRWRMELISKVDPNPGHGVISWMEGFFSEFTLITQNVDGLHDRAGNRHIFKLHGDLWEVRCVRCNKTSKLASVPSPHFLRLVSAEGHCGRGLSGLGNCCPSGNFLCLLTPWDIVSSSFLWELRQKFIRRHNYR